MHKDVVGKVGTMVLLSRDHPHTALALGPGYRTGWSCRAPGKDGIISPVDIAQRKFKGRGYRIIRGYSPQEEL